MTRGQPSSQEAVAKALAGTRNDLTVANIAQSTGLAQSTVRRAVTELELAGIARQAQSDGTPPKRWSIAGATATNDIGAAGQRLRRGELDALVLEFMKAHGADAQPTPAAIAKALGRSAGAVGNCLARLARHGKARQVSERPRRYSLTAEQPPSSARSRRAREEGRS